MTEIYGFKDLLELLFLYIYIQISTAVTSRGFILYGRDYNNAGKQYYWDTKQLITEEKLLGIN